MVSTREILYVLLITLAAGGVGSDEGGLPYGGILPLLLLLLLSTDNPRCCPDNFREPCCNRVLATPGFFGRGIF